MFDDHWCHITAVLLLPGNGCDEIYYPQWKLWISFYKIIVTATIFSYHVMILSINWLWSVVYFMSTDIYFCPHNHTYLQNYEMHGFTSSEISCTVMFCIYVYMWLLDIYLSTSVWNMCVMSLISEIWLQLIMWGFFLVWCVSCMDGKEWILLICKLSNSWGYWEALQSWEWEQYASE